MRWGRTRRAAVDTAEAERSPEPVVELGPEPNAEPEPEPAPRPDPAEVETARAVVARLQERRLLLDPPSLGLVGSIPAGIAAVVADLAELGEGVDPGTVLGTSLGELRGACHDLETRAEGQTHLWRQAADEAALLALGTFRGIVASNLARWSACYEFVIEEPLAGILPSRDVPDGEMAEAPETDAAEPDLPDAAEPDVLEEDSE